MSMVIEVPGTRPASTPASSEVGGCDFCQKTRREVRRLVVSNTTGVVICEACVDLAFRLLTMAQGARRG